MKTAFASFRPLVSAAVLTLGLIGTGCVHDQGAGSTTERKRIPLAPIGAASPGIGAGTIATGEGDTPLGEPGTGSVPTSGAGSVPGARNGGRL